MPAFTLPAASPSGHSARLLPKNSQVMVADQFTSLFIPETEGQRLETGKQSDRLHTLEQRVRLVAFLQMVIGNPRAQMMDMMESNVAGKPLQHAGQFVKRTALQRG